VGVIGLVVGAVCVDVADYLAHDTFPMWFCEIVTGKDYNEFCRIP
jgi:hypothetical protein